MKNNTASPATVHRSGSVADDVMALDREHVMSTYARRPVVFVRGQGARLWDSEGNEYLDFLAGIAVTVAGHCHPRVTAAIQDQVARLSHVSNLFYNELQPRLAQRLCALAGMDRVFFCNSGAEANETALKLARKWGKREGRSDRSEIISFAGSFHGRTFGALAATAQPKYQAPFEPLPPGFRCLPWNDLDAAEAAITDHACAVIVEAIQGESGIQVASEEFLRGLRQACNRAGALLIADEVQCGMGRTGDFLAMEGFGVHADVVTMAKGIANGFPIGACMARGAAATVLAPGDHGSTFAGQPPACAAALATLDVLEDENLMRNARETGAHFLAGLERLERKHPDRLESIRGRGLMVGVSFARPEAKLVLDRLFEHRLVANATGDHALRFVPPLTVTPDQCDRATDALSRVLQVS